jgi:hypothetical protein
MWGPIEAVYLLPWVFAMTGLCSDTIEKGSRLYLLHFTLYVFATFYNDLTEGR